MNENSHILIQLLEKIEECLKDYENIGKQSLLGHHRRFGEISKEGIFELGWKWKEWEVG